jgi:periplasmic protein TonB
MNSVAFSIQVSLGLHLGAFVIAIALSGFSSSVPHYHLQRGSPIVLEGSFAAAEPTTDSTFYLTLPPAPKHGETLSAATVESVELTPAAMDVRPVQTSIESSLAKIELPAAGEDCKCEAPEHEIQTPKRSLDAPPEFVSSFEEPTPLRRRDLSDAVPSVSTEVSLPPSSGSGGTDVDVLPRKVAANPRPPYPAEARRLGIQGVVILEVRVNAQGTVESLRIAESSGFDSLDKSALDTVTQWRFEPAYRGGQPVEAVVNVPVRFTIRS